MTISIPAEEKGVRLPSALRVRLSRLVCWIPSIAYLFIATFTAIAYFRVGHLPHYSHPDPTDLRRPVLEGAALLSYPLGLFSILAGFFLLTVARDSLRKSDIIAFLVGSAAWAFSFPLVGRIFEWLID